MVLDGLLRAPESFMESFLVPPFPVLCPGRPDENGRENESLIKKVDWKRAWKKVIFGSPNGGNMGAKLSQSRLEKLRK